METRAIPTPLSGVFVVETQFVHDERGFFIENYHKQRFSELGLVADFVQDNHSRSGSSVLRGLHYQDTSAPMAKLVRCTVGAVYDVAVDIRVGSPTFGKWYAVELTASNMKQLWIPSGFAHGFLTLSEAAEVQYKCSGFYTPSAEGTVAWDDPQLAIEWPMKQPALSQRDRQAMSLQRYLEKPAFLYDHSTGT